MVGFCQRCGTGHAAGALFCSSCGQRFEEAPPPPNNPNVASDNAAIAGWFLILAFVIVDGVGWVWSWNNTHESIGVTVVFGIFWTMIVLVGVGLLAAVGGIALALISPIFWLGRRKR